MSRRSSGKLVVTESDQTLQIRVNIMYRWVTMYINAEISY